MALVSVTVIKCYICKTSELPCVKLFESSIELANSPVLIWNNSDTFLKYPLQGAFCNTKLSLNGYQDFLPRVIGNFFGSIFDELYLRFDPCN